MIPEMQAVGVLDKRFLSRSLGLLDPHPPLTVQSGSPAKDALKLLREHKIGCVVIVDKLDKICGIFSERDVVLKLVMTGVDITATPIDELMTKNPETATMTTTIAFALNMMSEGGFRHIPVVDDDAVPIGMVSVKSIVDYIVKSVVRDISL